MAWAGKGRAETPLPLRLIQSAMSLWKYVIRGKELPRTEVNELRDQTRFEDRQASRQFQAELRYLIGAMTLDPKSMFNIGGQNIGPFVMSILCYPYEKNRRTLEVVLGLSHLLEFTLGGYNLKEMTALASRADIWLEEMRGHNSPDEIEKRRKVETLLDSLLEVLATTREENYELIVKARYQRNAAPVNVSLENELLAGPPSEEMAAEAEHLQQVATDAWNWLRRFPSQEALEFQELQKRRSALENQFQRELDRLERRLQKRREKLTRFEQKLGRQLDEGEQKPYLITDEEQRWKDETEAQLRSLQKRPGRLWAMFAASVGPEVEVILSLSDKSDELRGKLQGGA